MEYGMEDFWYGMEMEETYQYGIWKNRFPFHSIPCPSRCADEIKLISAQRNDSMQ